MSRAHETTRPAVLGLDFGGTKLAAGVVDPISGEILARGVCPTADNAENSLAAMLSLARASLTASGIDRNRGRLAAVGVSFGGPIAPDGRTIRLSMHVPGWENINLASRLEDLFSVPATVANDGDAAALAEYRFGAGRGVKHLLYLTVSTGVGGGVIVGGKMHRGERAWAGEVGHMLLKSDGPVCPCGRRGCLESLASGRSIARDAKARLAPRADGGEWTAADVAVAAAQSDGHAAAVWNEAMTWLGRGIGSAANLLNPGRVVIGGGLTKAGQRMLDPVRAAAAERALDPDLEIALAELGQDTGIVGGAIAGWDALDAVPCVHSKAASSVLRAG